MQRTVFLKYKPKLQLKIAIILVFVLGLLFSISPAPQKTNALSGAEFNPGRIIDDLVFYNSNSMSVSQIQSFLKAKVPKCDTHGTKMYNGSQTRAQWAAANGRPLPPYTCLKNYKQSVPAITNGGSDLCKSSISGGNKSAAQIIYDVGKACGINPQVLIVLLQKEQSLVTDDWPWPRQYEIATGYGCPDTAPCDAEYYGFFNQVYQAAKAFRRYEANPGWYNYRAGRNNTILWHPNTSCGTSNVYIQNQATASLYIYTPYRPNNAALFPNSGPNGLYGTGDACSSYGNRNFWRTFRDWFGSVYSNDTTQAHPDGTLITLDNKVYLIENGKRRHIVTPDAFESYGYKWNQVKKATIGDWELPTGSSIKYLAPGTLFTTHNSPVYVMEFHNNEIVKRHVSYQAFTSLGYKWSDVLNISAKYAPSKTHPSLLTKTEHPSGSLVVSGDKVYLIEKRKMRHILTPLAFESYNFAWSNVKPATPLDRKLPKGDSLNFREGTLLHSSGNIYVIDYDESGIMKRPLGPWECFADRLNFKKSEWISTPTSSVPKRTGPLFTC